MTLSTFLYVIRRKSLISFNIFVTIHIDYPGSVLRSYIYVDFNLHIFCSSMAETRGLDSRQYTSSLLGIGEGQM